MVIHVFIFIILQGAIIIHEVYEDGAAAKDGRVWAGDQVLEVTDDVFILLISCRVVRKTATPLLI